MGTKPQTETSAYRLGYNGSQFYIAAAVLVALAVILIGLSALDVSPLANRAILLAAVVAAWGAYKAMQIARRHSADTAGYLKFDPDVVHIHLLRPTERNTSDQSGPPTLRIPRDKMIWIRRTTRPRNEDPTMHFVEIRVTPELWLEAKTLTQTYQSFDDVMNDDPAIGTLQFLSPDILRVRVDRTIPDDGLLSAWTAFDYPQIEDHTISA